MRVALRFQGALSTLILNLEAGIRVGGDVQRRHSAGRDQDRPKLGPRAPYTYGVSGGGDAIFIEVYPKKNEQKRILELFYPEMTRTFFEQFRGITI